jgi:hypothetical protein
LEPFEYVTELFCCVCKVDFGTPEDLEYHFQEHTNDFVPNVTKCRRCPNYKPFPDYDSFLNHSRGHAETKIIECLQCKRKFPPRFKVLKHLQEHESKVGLDLECKECKHVFSTLRTLKTHIRFMHQGEALFFCDL